MDKYYDLVRGKKNIFRKESFPTIRYRELFRKYWKILKNLWKRKNLQKFFKKKFTEIQFKTNIHNVYTSYF